MSSPFYANTAIVNYWGMKTSLKLKAGISIYFKYFLNKFQISKYFETESTFSMLKDWISRVIIEWLFICVGPLVLNSLKRSVQTTLVYFMSVIYLNVLAYLHTYCYCLSTCVTVSCSYTQHLSRPRTWQLLEFILSANNFYLLHPAFTRTTFLFPSKPVTGSPHIIHQSLV